MTIQEYCEENHPCGHLQSLYFVLSVEFGVTPEDQISAELKTFLVSLEPPRGGLLEPRSTGM